ncbi:hypothetical protein [Zophobihabitans entericus]|uniref:Uncharacterized protein n=1 Tax=Zophobihabitans entericus TaxID=1635327 RepID=A0A6G9IBH3_9GAMM|nr:hypothetical protein [Zophobihabitans entericus]QIQ21573.1 hypothetical protein IPMB12_07680 [Zophobihabitans entericus]
MSFYSLQNILYLPIHQLGLVVILSVCIMAICSFIGARIATTELIRFSSAIYTTGYFIIGLFLLRFLSKFFNIERYLTGNYNLITFALLFLLLTILSSREYRVSFTKGVFIAFITSLLLALALMAVSSLLPRY